MTRRHRSLVPVGLLLCAFTAQGCFYERFELGEQHQGVGGSSAIGGTSTVGGSSASGGSTAKGGSSASGGSTAKGGSSASGGSTAKGGSSASGGSAAKGGSIATGGSGTTGGSTARGGTSAIGGSTVRGGTSATGGSGGTTSIVPPSCRALTADCLGGDCCTTINVAPGSFRRGRSEIEGVGDYYAINNDLEVPEHDAQITFAFALDKFEVTVGRFRAFVEDYDAWHVTGFNPKVGAGAHPASANTGWKQIWSDDVTRVPANAAALIAKLHCDATNATWTDTPNTASDNLPINCVNWYLATAFCIWDGGRLPTETEWEYVAANGASNQLYPWGNAAPTTLTVNFLDTDNTPFLPVGSKPAGAGALGHLDLSGSMWEWVFDSFSMIVYQTFATKTCIDCFFTGEGGLYGGTEPYNVLRGGGWSLPTTYLRSAHRGGNPRINSLPSAGVRCARPAVP